MVNHLSILGSTGSIGTQTLDVCRKLNLGVTALSAYSSIGLLEEQIREFKPALAVVYDEEKAKAMTEKLRITFNGHTLDKVGSIVQLADCAMLGYIVQTHIPIIVNAVIVVDKRQINAYLIGIRHRIKAVVRTPAIGISADTEQFIMHRSVAKEPFVVLKKDLSRRNVLHRERGRLSASAHGRI